MNILSWSIGILWTGFQLLLSLVWFLVGGWFSTLAQIFILFCIVLIYKYGWRRAPAEILSRVSALLRYTWAWVRLREVPSMAKNRDSIPFVRVKEFGDINVSSLLNVIMFFSLILYTFS